MNDAVFTVAVAAILLIGSLIILAGLWAIVRKAFAEANRHINDSLTDGLTAIDIDRWEAGE